MTSDNENESPLPTAAVATKVSGFENRLKLASTADKTCTDLHRLACIMSKLWVPALGDQVTAVCLQ